MVPLGGPRAMTVRRTLPDRSRSLIGGWCFADHYGPDDVTGTGGMRVPPHPHTGLQTVSWLFSGEIEHRDSLGSHAMVRPGELNLMTAGHGIAHSEVSTASTTLLSGVQLWVALPAHARDMAPAFDRFVPDVVEDGSATWRVFLGSVAGLSSPVATHSPLVGAELVLAAGSELEIAVDPAFEHGVLVDDGAVVLGSGLVGRARIGAAELGYLPPGVRTISVAAPDGPARLILLGGEPLGEQIVMWWNFVGRDHDEIVEFRAAWQAELTGRSAATGPPRFGPVPGYPGLALPAPVMPGGRLRPRL
jgi:redox-sensitive bicupin YhaK (pirin superfamily)